MGGTRAAVAQGIAFVKEMLVSANTAQREPCSVSHLKVACSAVLGWLLRYQRQPRAGAAVDRLVAHGGTAILSETLKSMAPNTS